MHCPYRNTTKGMNLDMTKTSKTLRDYLIKHCVKLLVEHKAISCHVRHVGESQCGLESLSSIATLIPPSYNFSSLKDLHSLLTENFTWRMIFIQGAIEFNKLLHSFCIQTFHSFMPSSIKMNNCYLNFDFGCSGFRL